MRPSVRGWGPGLQLGVGGWKGGAGAAGGWGQASQASVGWGGDKFGANPGDTQKEPGAGELGRTEGQGAPRAHGRLQPSGLPSGGASPLRGVPPTPSTCGVHDGHVGLESGGAPEGPSRALRLQARAPRLARSPRGGVAELVQLPAAERAQPPPRDCAPVPPKRGAVPPTQALPGEAWGGGAARTGGTKALHKAGALPTRPAGTSPCAHRAGTPGGAAARAPGCRLQAAGCGVQAAAGGMQGEMQGEDAQGAPARYLDQAGGARLPRLGPASHGGRGIWGRGGARAAGPGCPGRSLRLGSARLRLGSAALGSSARAPRPR